MYECPFHDHNYTYPYNITKVNRALWLVSQPLPFAHGCTPRNWASAVKFGQIQQISSPDGKIHRWNAQMKSRSWRKYKAGVLKEKRQKSKRQICPGWMIWLAICFKIMTRYTCGFFPRILAIIPATQYTCVFLSRIRAFYSQVYDHFLTNAHIYAHKKTHTYALQTSMWYMGLQKVVV